MKRRRIIAVTVGVFAAVIALGAVLPITVYTRTISTCILCRRECTDHRYLGYHWRTFQDTQFTAWYSAHRPEHEHQWTRLNCTRGQNVFGGVTYWACAARHPVCDIPPEAMRDFAEGADAAELNAFFQAIRSTDRETQRKAVDAAWQSLFNRDN